MLRAHLTVLLLAMGNNLVAAQSPPSPPQTARQALIEMFTGKSPDAFEKHLPEAARHALIHKGDAGETSLVQQFAAATRELSSQGKLLQTFDTGALLLSVEDKNGQGKFEVTVERDNLTGEEDEIEVSFQISEGGEVKPMPVVPRFIFTMKQEKDIWRVSEAELVVHAPLADPEYLKTLTTMQNERNEAMAEGRIGDVARLEKQYAASNPQRGYTCKLSDLTSQNNQVNSGQADEEQPPAMPSGPANVGDDNFGFRFAIGGCNAVPATKFHVTAVPIDPDSGMKSYCADNSDKIRFANDGTAAGCLSAGEIVKQEAGTID
jgi:hypothetical protein